MVRGLHSIYSRAKKSTSFNQELGGDVVLVAHKCLDYDAKVEIIPKYKSSIVYFSLQKRLHKLLNN